MNRQQILKSGRSFVENIIKLRGVRLILCLDILIEGFLRVFDIFMQGNGVLVKYIKAFGSECIAQRIFSWNK